MKGNEQTFSHYRTKSVRFEIIFRQAEHLEKDISPIVIRAKEKMICCQQDLYVDQPVNFISYDS